MHDVFTANNDEHDVDTVSIIAHALVEKFGDRASDVAQKLFAFAAEESRAKWASALNQLRSKD